MLQHVHTVTITDGGHTHVQNVNSGTTGGTNGYAVDTSTNTSSASGYSTASATTGITAADSNPASSVASFTKTHSLTNNAVTSGAGAAHAHTLSWPAGVPTAASTAVTMNSFDNRSAYIKLIGCKAD
jgi:hypothetical protein